MRKLVHRSTKADRLSKMLICPADITKCFIFIEFQNTSHITSLNLIFKALSHCTLASCCSCSLSKVIEFGENSTKVFLTQSYLSDDKNITPVFPNAGQKSPKYFDRFFPFFPILKILFVYSTISRVSENHGWKTVV
jgi:hypothetical protein